MKNYEMYPYRLVSHEIEKESKESGVPVGKLHAILWNVKQLRNRITR